ncbi:hypothetical protein [Pararhizobium sp. DWP3-4]|uniref:hypothetical protein n=1 Tax=Pararhizobium sp. DWP3-4 TaxID=2804565 RepID=UPI003CEBC07A
MEFPKLKFFGEVQKTLAPVLDHLGLKARMREWWGYPTIQFETPDGTMRSPICLVLRNPDPSNKAGSRWKGHTIQYTGHDERPLGDSGWTFVKFVAMDEEYLKGSDNASARTLARDLMDFNLTFTETHPMATFEIEVFNTYNNLRKMLKRSDNPTVECQRSGKLEILKFNDHAGRAWSIEFGEQVTVSVDGASLKTFRYYEAETIMPFVKRTISKIKPEVTTDCTNAMTR